MAGSGWTKKNWAGVQKHHVELAVSEGWAQQGEGFLWAQNEAISKHNKTPPEYSAAAVTLCNMGLCIFPELSVPGV